MRESIGGTWLTGIVICFLFLFAAFLTYAINYTKAFRVKNNIIQIIEEDEGYVEIENEGDVSLEDLSIDDLSSMNTTNARIMYFIKMVGYNYDNNIACDVESGEIQGPGVCIQKHCVNTDNANKVYYKVTSYISLTIPVVNVPISIPISGETNTIYSDRGGSVGDTNLTHCYTGTD